jgi:hypothetical protein
MCLVTASLSEPPPEKATTCGIQQGLWRVEVAAVINPALGVRDKGEIGVGANIQNLWIASKFTRIASTLDENDAKINTQDCSFTLDNQL